MEASDAEIVNSCLSAEEFKETLRLHELLLKELLTKNHRWYDILSESEEFAELAIEKIKESQSQMCQLIIQFEEIIFQFMFFDEEGNLISEENMDFKKQWISANEKITKLYEDRLMELKAEHKKSLASLLQAALNEKLKAADSEIVDSCLCADEFQETLRMQELLLKELLTKNQRWHDILNQSEEFEELANEKIMEAQSEMGQILLEFEETIFQLMANQDTENQVSGKKVDFETKWISANKEITRQYEDRLLELKTEHLKSLSDLLQDTLDQKGKENLEDTKTYEFAARIENFLRSWIEKQRKS